MTCCWLQTQEDCSREVSTARKKTEGRSKTQTSVDDCAPLSHAVCSSYNSLFCIHTLYSILMMVHGSVVGVADESKTTPFSLIRIINLSFALTGLLSTVSCRERERERERVGRERERKSSLYAGMTRGQRSGVTWCLHSEPRCCQGQQSHDLHH